MRFVFDTNVYVSAFVIVGSGSDLAFRLALRGAFDSVRFCFAWRLLQYW